jgi:membrane protease subunit HflC
MKTIDVDPVDQPGDGWPPRRRKTKVSLPRHLVPVLILISAAGLLLVLGLTGRLGVTVIDPTEVAVKVNFVTGGKQVIQQPGYQVYIPWLEEVFVLDRSPQTFVMEGPKARSQNQVEQLTVRASDGSNFRFDSVTIQYDLIPERAADLLEDSGTGNGFKQEWVRAHARSVLRDEFGRYTAEDIADPTTYERARIESTDRLNELLAPHGVRILQIIQPNPKFDPEYERAIEDRKLADKEVERLQAKKDQLLREREQHLSAVEKEKEIEWQTLRGDLTRNRLAAEEESIRLRRAADAYALERTARGQAERAEKLAEAGGLTEKYTKEAEGLMAKARALEERGEVVVREAVVQKLSEITFELVPYSKDPAPKRLEHVDRRGDVGTSSATEGKE